MLNMETPVPAIVQQQQQSLFNDPISKLYQAQDSYTEEDKMIKEMEKDYPIELEDKILALKDLQKEVKELKDEFLRQLQKDDAYAEAVTRRAELQLEIDDAIKNVKELANTESASGDFTLNLIVDGRAFYLATQKQNHVFLDGKEL